MKVVWTLVVAVAVVCAVLAGVIYSGLYNVAASDPHTAAVRWVLSATRVNSVQARAAAEVAVPPGLSEAATITEGARKYAQMCAECHGSPVEKGHAWAAHMRPAPPGMAHAAEFWEPQELYWIVEHGFKMTGMPAWGALMEPEEMWAVVAFVEAYPGLSADRYREMTGGGGEAADAAAPEPEPEPEPDGAAEQAPESGAAPAEETPAAQ